MAILTRCDECKRLSDESGIRYIGRNHEIKAYREVIVTIKTKNDLCQDCIKKIISTGDIQQEDSDRY